MVRAGCFGSGSCGGTLGIGFAAALFSYSTSNTSNATINTADLKLNIGPFNALKIGTCGIAGASGSGDTFLRLHDSSGNQVALNDNGCGALSQLTFNNSFPTPGTYLIRVGCFGTSSCSGMVAYSIE